MSGDAPAAPARRGVTPDPPTLAGEREALVHARAAADSKLERLAGVSGGGIDEDTDRFIDAVIGATMDRLRQELVVFGRVDDDSIWRVGIFGIDSAGEQVVVDWRAPFAAGFYQATLDDPHGLRRRVSYVGCIDDLMVEDLVSGGISGSSPLMAELSRSRGSEMRTAVATLQADQDRLVRLDPASRLVLRGGPGTGKTVVALHRAAWIVYNDRRITSDRILVLGPSDRFLQFVSTVLPTLGEARIQQTTLARHLGTTTEVGNDPRWLDVLDRFEASLVAPARISVRGSAVPADEVARIVERIATANLPWRERRSVLATRLATLLDVPVTQARAAIGDVMVAMSATGAWRKLRQRATLAALGVERGFIDAWLAVDDDGALRDEVKARFDGVETKYAHVIVDEAQDLTLFQLRAVMRRADGLTLVGDDAQRSVAAGLGLRAAAVMLETGLEQMDTAYRMSAEIAEWLNAHARRHGIDAVMLVGIRPTGVAVSEVDDGEADRQEARLRSAWANVATIGAGEVWDHKGVEYDAVMVRRRGLSPSEVYLAASRAAHELVLA